MVRPGHDLTVLESLDKELPATPHFADQLWKVRDEGSGQIHLVLLEAAIRLRRKEIQRILVRAARAHQVFDLPVTTCILALSPSDTSPQLMEGYGWSVGGEPWLTCRMDTLALWRYDAEAALDSSSPAAWLLSTHMSGGDTPSVFERAAHQLQTSDGLSTTSRLDLLGVLRILGERRLGDLARSIITLEMLMGSTLYEEIAADVEKKRRQQWEATGLMRGRQEGRQEGRHEGRQEGLLRQLADTRDITLSLVEHRCGPPPQEVREAIAAIDDLGRLRTLILALAEVRSLEEVRRLLSDV